MNSSPPHPKTIDLVVCYIRMCIPGPFSSSSLIFLLDYVILFFFCVCASTTSLLFLLPSSPWILCLPTWSRPCPPTHHSTSFSRWFSNAEKEKKRKWSQGLEQKKSFLFSIVISVSFRRLCVCVCWVSSMQAFCHSRKKKSFYWCHHHRPTNNLIHHFFTSQQLNLPLLKILGKIKKFFGSRNVPK